MVLNVHRNRTGRGDGVGGYGGRGRDVSSHLSYIYIFIYELYIWQGCEGPISEVYPSLIGLSGFGEKDRGNEQFP